MTTLHTAELKLRAYYQGRNTAHRGEGDNPFNYTTEPELAEQFNQGWCDARRERQLGGV